jgi:putative aldouronate transport system permease protein
VGQSISYATVVSMLKSLVSVALLFVANTLSKAVRKESII